MGCGSPKYHPSVKRVLIVESKPALSWVFSRDRTFRDFECIDTRTQTSNGHACPALILRICMRDGKIDNLNPQYEDARPFSEGMAAVLVREQPAGKEWKYSGGGFTIMQQTLIDVTKEPFPNLLHDTVLAPIGMTRSTYEQPLPPSLRENAAMPTGETVKRSRAAHTRIPRWRRPDCGPPRRI